MKFFLLLTFILSILFESYSQNGKKRCGIDYPTTLCQIEEINGDVTLNWKQPTDPNGEFLNYELYSVESPFVVITKINSITINSYTIPANFKDNNFFIVTNALCNNVLTKFYSDTNTITILNSVKIEEGIEQISWDENINFKNDSIYIERKTETSNWKRIDSLLFNQKIYLDTVDICNKNLLYYRISSKKNGCTTYSTVISETLKDTYHPNIPKIVSVGYDTIKENLIISWKKTRERDIQGYIIYQDNNGVNTELATIFNSLNKIDTSYTIYNPSKNSILNYRIAAFDYCYSIAPKFQTSAQSQPFFSTFLNYEYNVCNKEINLNWNKIITNDEIKQYKIFLKKNKRWKCIDSTNNENYKFNLEKFTTNIISIESETTQGYKFFSNLCEIYSKSPSEPKISYTNYASVINNNIEIKHSLSLTPGLKQIALFKLNNQNEFIEIEKKEANQPEIIFIDKDVNTSKFSYNYYIQHIDSCGNYTQKNLIQKTILLKENFQDEDSLITSIIYNSYKGFFGGNNKFIIEKSINDEEFKKIDEEYTDSLGLYTNKIKDIETFEGKICYQIKGIENQNKFGSQSISLSNSVCFYFSPKIFIPNSFTPTGKNPIFIPKVSIAKINEYEFIIYNRWGEPVFYTKNIDEGWNGNYGSNTASNGLYIYLLKINSGSNKEIIKRGLVNLIR